MIFDLNLPAWYDDALCAEIGGDMFFPVQGENFGPARLICRECPVRQKCLDYAMENNEPHGIWGGLTPTERRRMRRDAA